LIEIEQQPIKNHVTFESMRLVCRFGVLILLILGTGPLVLGQSRSTLEKKKKKIENDIKYTENLIQQTRQKQNSSVDALQKISAGIEAREQLVLTLGTEISVLDSSLAAGRRESQRLLQLLDKQKLAYAGMVRAAFIQRRRQTGLIPILSSPNPGVLLRRSEYIERMAKLRQQKVNSIQRTNTQLTYQLQQLDTLRQQKNLALNEQQIQAQKLEQERQRKEVLLNQLKGKEKELLKRLSRKQGEAVALARKIDGIIAAELKAAKLRDEKAAKVKEKEATASGSKAPIPATPESVSLGNDFSSNRGRLPWPVKYGIVTGKFGTQPHPVFQHVTIQRDGVDISTQRGEKALAVFRGEVSAVFALEGYQNVVIVRHGTYLTVYGNLDQVLVKKGQNLKTGDPIGTVYMDDEDGKTALHFRVMNGQIAENPQSWIIKR
jgi:septal ring factor EnvC (AmiA/AmiB activator)